MPVFAQLIISIVNVLLFVLQTAMLLRALLSWFPGMEDNKFTDFLYAITEPLIVPVRALFERFGWFQNIPMDIAFFVSYLLLAMLSVFLDIIA